jgi:hypothetical protein
MIRRPARPALLVLVTATIAVGLPASAGAQSTTPTPTPTTPTQGTPTQGTVDIHNCTVKRSRNAGGFTWFTCTLTSSLSTAQTASVRYTANLASFTPNRSTAGSDWSRSTGTLAFGRGDSIEAIKVALRNRNLTVAQVRSRLRVTLSNPTGIAIGDGTATATHANAG